MMTIIKKLGKVAVTVEKESWKDYKDYDRLVIVRKGNITYITRKPVPAGTNVSNTEYYLPLGYPEGGGSSIDDTIINEIETSVQESASNIDTLTELLNGFGLTINDIIEEIASINSRLDNMSTTAATVSVSTDKSSIFANEQTNIKITVNCNKQASSIKIKLGNDILYTTSNTSSATYTHQNVNRNTDLVYSVEAVIDGQTITSSKTVKVYYPIYYGVGYASGNDKQDNFAQITTRNSTPKATIAGNYSIQNTISGNYLYFLVPNSMGGINSMQMNMLEIPRSQYDNINKNGTTYKVYKSLEPFRALTLNIVIA